MPEDSAFARLVSLACHDLRTPLATVHGFAHTIPRLADFDEQPLRYLRMIEEASAQLAELLDELSIAARIEAGRYDPEFGEADSLELATAAAERFEPERVRVSGDGAAVRVDKTAVVRALFGLANCALRHGGLETVELTVSGREVAIGPVTPAAAPIVLGENLRDLGAAVGRVVVEAGGGSVALEGNRLHVRLPGVV